jgi:hypothetical protein
VTTLKQRPPAIAGVSTGPALIMVVYPSIAATAIGKGLGKLYELIPIRVGGIKLSHLLFCLPSAPFAAVGYFLMKLSGEVYALTTRSVQLRNSLGNRLIREVPMSSIDQVVIRQEPGQEFYPAADIYLLNKAGETIMTLPGVPRAEVFRQTILEARSAQDQVAAALTTIGARKPE